MKNRIFAILAGTLTLFLLGYLIYIVMFGNSDFHITSQFNSVAKEPYIPTLLIMELLYAILIVLIFSRWANIKTFTTGLKAGFVIGLIIGGSMMLYWFSVSTVTNINGILFSSITFGIRFAIAGGVIGWFLGKE